MNRSDLPRVADVLERFAADLRAHGEVLWDRSHDWTTTHNQWNRDEPPEDDTPGDRVSESDKEERRLDAQASRYCTEVVQLLGRLEADAVRGRRLVEIICPGQPRKLKPTELSPTQIAGEGWCVSCWRDDSYIEPVHAGYYRDACRACGDWRSAHDGEWPPVHVVRWRHRHPGKRVPLAIVEQVGKA